MMCVTNSDCVGGGGGSIPSRQKHLLELPLKSKPSTVSFADSVCKTFAFPPKHPVILSAELWHVFSVEREEKAGTKKQQLEK